MTTMEKEKQGSCAGLIKQRDGVQHRKEIKLITTGPNQWRDFTLDFFLKDVESSLRS